jgi:eukaryotic-like serine/threonine-protein kinase
MSEITAEQLAQRIFDVGLMGSKEIETVLQAAGGRGRATFDAFVFALLERESLTNWQISRVVEGHTQGYTFGNWGILYLIGHGTFARVYRAFHRKTGDIKAVKVLRNRYSTDLEQREQFLREARMVMKLRHPNIVPIHEVEEEKGRIYMVMDFVEGQNLREYVHAHHKLNVITALRIIRDIASGLAYAAQSNITHRDLKLSNVLLSSKGQAKLVDFGLATVNDPEEKGEKGGPRSIDYAGLERTTGAKRNDPRSDIYFLGCMLYHMVSGKPPLFETRERIKRLSSQRYVDIVPVTQYAPDLPHRVVILINRLMELDVDKRIQTPVIVVQETESVLHALESGDSAQYDPALSEEQARRYAQQQIQKEEGANKTLLIIESNVKLQNTLRDRLKSVGYRILITADPERGLAKFSDVEPGETNLPADAVLFGCGGLGRAGIEAFTQFISGKATSRIPAVLMVTEKLAHQVKPEWFNEIRDVIGLPLKVRTLRSKLRSVLNLQDPERKDYISSDSQRTERFGSSDTDVDDEKD